MSFPRFVIVGNKYTFRRAVSCCVFLASFFVLSACSTRDLGDIDKAPAYVHPELHAIGELPPYKVRIGDVLDIKFLYNDEFDQEIIVRPDGIISTAAAQSVKAAGRTPSDIADELTKRYLSHLREPNLSVLVKTFEPTRIFVLGEVEEPGEYTSVVPNPSLLQILARAGGVKISGKGEQVLIVRKDDVQQPVFYLAHYDDVVEGRDPLADVQLTSNDVVFVPKTAVADVYGVYDQYIRQFALRDSLD